MPDEIYRRFPDGSPEAARAVYGGAIAAGFNRNSAAALTGRARQENDFGSYVGDGGTSFGIFQLGRGVYNAWIKHAKANNLPVESQRGQSEFFSNYYKENRPKGFQAMQKAKTPTEAFNTWTGKDWNYGGRKDIGRTFAEEFGKTMGGEPAVETPTNANFSRGNFLEINAGDTSQDPGGISSREISLGDDTSLGSDVQTDFTGPQYSEPLYQPSGQESPAIPVTDYGARNPFDEWWRSTPVTGSASGDAGVSASDGGSIWSGEDTIGNFGGNRETTDFVSDLSLGPELNADPALLNEGHGYPPDLPPIDETGVNQPPPPQPSGDEWTTTSPDDRRYLSEVGEGPTVEASRPSMGADLRNPTLGRFNPVDPNLSLGAFFGTPWEAMRYGNDWPQPQITSGGRPPDLQTGEGYIPRDGDGGTWVERPDGSGSDWRENATPNPNPRNDGTGTTIIPIESTTPTVSDRSPSGLMTPSGYERAAWGGVRPTGYRDPRGSAIGNSPENVRNANLMLMSSQAFGGTPNDNAYSSDEGATRRFGMIGRMNEFGEYEQTGDIDPFYRSNMENYRGLVYGSQNRPRGVPATGRGG